MTQSLSNFIFSIFAGAIVVGAIAIAVSVVSTNDRILRE